MSHKKLNIDSKALARDIEDKIKNAVKDGNIMQDIPSIIMDVMKSYGIELPEKAQQVLQEYQQSSKL
jgi:uncharacterized protein YpuA (DUF1002 family)